MIYGVTGLPGNGKTLYALAWVKAKSESEGRPVFYAGIKGLTLPWTEIDPTKWFDYPANAIVVIDECQRFFGVRGRGAPIPEHAQQLETHRHLGIDIVLITQSPMLLDNHDRSLIGTHFHVVRNFGLNRATVYEFQQCKDNVLKSRADGIRHEWRYPKEAFEWYQSAEVHTHKARIPARVWILLALPFIIAGLCWVLYARWSAKIQGSDLPVPPAGQARIVAGASRQAVPVGEHEKGEVMTTERYLSVHTPRVPGLAYTAPVYDEVTKPTEAPYPAAVIASASRCQAYTQQGTQLDMTDAMCRQIAKTGFFMAWGRQSSREVMAPQVVKTAAVEAPSSGWASLGGPRAAPVVAPVRYDGYVDQETARQAPNARSGHPTPQAGR